MDDLTGRIFGRLKVITFLGYQNKLQTYMCKCDCGNEKTTTRAGLIRGMTKSCGCMRKENSKKLLQTHGVSKEPAYIAIVHAISRCHNPKDKKYHNYGGRGISVCEEWRNDPTKIVEYLGPKPSKEHSLDRIDNDGNYEPGNVRWASRDEQHFNRRITRFIEIDGVTKSLSQWCKIYNVCRQNVDMKIKRGMSPIDAFTSTGIHKSKSAALYRKGLS